MKEKKKKKGIVSTLDKIIIFTSLVLFVAIPFTKVFLQATLSKVNVEVEQIRKEIRTQEKKNESLTMKINELASLDKIIEVAQEQGLSYNNDNIKSVE